MTNIEINLGLKKSFIGTAPDLRFIFLQSLYKRNICLEILRKYFQFVPEVSEGTVVPTIIVSANMSYYSRISIS